LTKVASKLRVRSLQKEQTQLRKSVLKARDRKLQERTAAVPAAGRGIWSSDSDSDSNSDMNYPSCLRTCDPNLLEEVDNAFNAGADAMSVDSPCGALFHLMNNSCFSDACSDDPAFQAIMPIVDLCESFAGAPPYIILSPASLRSADSGVAQHSTALDIRSESSRRG